MSDSITLPAPAKSPKKPAPERRAAILEHASPADPDGWFAFRISFTSTLTRSQAVRTEVWNYLAREIPAGGMGHGCRGWEVEKLGLDLTPTGEVYHVLIDPRDGYSSCDCTGGQYHGHCKHREGIEALVAQGQLPPKFRSGGDMKRNAPDELGAHLASIADAFDTPEGDQRYGLPAEARELAYLPDEAPEMYPAEHGAPWEQPEPWEYPDEPPSLPAWSDYEPGEEGPEPDRAA